MTSGSQQAWDIHPVGRIVLSYSKPWLSDIDQWDQKWNFIIIIIWLTLCMKEYVLCMVPHPWHHCTSATQPLSSSMFLACFEEASDKPGKEGWLMLLPVYTNNYHLLSSSDTQDRHKINVLTLVGVHTLSNLAWPAPSQARCQGILQYSLWTT